MNKHLFHFTINNWETWGQVFCSKEAFSPLIQKIFEIENLEFQPPENCKPGTNGVFRVGQYLIKLFVPIDSGYDSHPDYIAELFALNRSNTLGISVPPLVAKGEIQDKYLFRYLIMSFVTGQTLGDLKQTLHKSDKYAIGKKLRHIVNEWSTPCENFNGLNVIERTLSSQRWLDAPPSFKTAQHNYLLQLKNDPLVYVHGDLTEDNLMISEDGKVTVIDFADSVCAPAIYEEMTLICDAFGFDMDFLEGYYGSVTHEEILERCVRAILCHQYGYHVVHNVFGPLDSIESLKMAILEKLRAR